MIAQRRSAAARVREAWGDNPPDWVLALAEACDAISQAKIAARIGWSAATISYVLKHRYPGRLDRIESSVRRMVMNPLVECPVLGEIAPERCTSEQRQPYSPHHPQRVALYRACRTCPFSRTPKGVEHAHDQQ